MTRCNARQYLQFKKKKKTHSFDIFTYFTNDYKTHDMQFHT